MSIAPTLQRYLTAENIQYDVIPHDPTMSSARAAEASPFMVKLRHWKFDRLLSKKLPELASEGGSK